MNNYEVMNMLSKLSKEDDYSKTKTYVAIGIAVLAGVAYYHYWTKTNTMKLMYGLREEQEDLKRKYENLLSENQRLLQNQKNLQQTIAGLGREKQALVDRLKQQESGDSAAN
jgi:hypothetical protein